MCSTIYGTEWLELACNVTVADTRDSRVLQRDENERGKTKPRERKELAPPQRPQNCSDSSPSFLLLIVFLPRLFNPAPPHSQYHALPTASRPLLTAPPAPPVKHVRRSSPLASTRPAALPPPSLALPQLHPVPTHRVVSPTDSSSPARSSNSLPPHFFSAPPSLSLLLPLHTPLASPRSARYCTHAGCPAAVAVANERN